MKNASLEASRRFVAILATIFVILSSGFPVRAEGQNATDAKVLTMRDRLEKTIIESVEHEYNNSQSNNSVHSMIDSTV